MYVMCWGRIPDMYIVYVMCWGRSPHLVALRVRATCLEVFFQNISAAVALCSDRNNQPDISISGRALPTFESVIRIGLQIWIGFGFGNTDFTKIRLIVIGSQSTNAFLINSFYNEILFLPETGKNEKHTLCTHTNTHTRIKQKNYVNIIILKGISLLLWILCEIYTESGIAIFSGNVKTNILIYPYIFFTFNKKNNAK